MMRQKSPPLQGHKKNWGAKAQQGLMRKPELGNTNTPFEWAKQLVEQHLRPEVSALWSKGPFLEPAVGTGNFYIAVLEVMETLGWNPWDVAQRFMALDKDEAALRIFKSRLRARWGWSSESIQALPIWHIPDGLVAFHPPDWVREGFGCILTNPPYLAPIRWADTPEKREEERQRWAHALEKKIDVRSDLYLYFFYWIQKHLAIGGKGVLLCSDSWVEADFGKSWRAELARGLSGVEPALPTLGEKPIKEKLPVKPMRPYVVLEQLKAWPWASGFRDDTSPVWMVWSKQNTPGQHVHWMLDEGDPLSIQEEPYFQLGKKVMGDKTFEKVSNGSGGLKKGMLAHHEPTHTSISASINISNPWLHDAWVTLSRRHHEAFWEAQEVQAWLSEKTPHRRLKLIWPRALEQAVEQVFEKFNWVLLGSQAVMDTFPWSIKDLWKSEGVIHQQHAIEGLVITEDMEVDRAKRWHDEQAESIPVCFHKQARTGKSVLQRPLKDNEGFSCRWNGLKSTGKWHKRIQKHGLKKGGLWLGVVFDRFPQWAWSHPASQWVGVSKFIHWQAKPNLSTSFFASNVEGACLSSVESVVRMERLWAALGLSTLGGLCLERGLKEGTRKSQRKDEKGFVKEVCKVSLEQLRWPDVRAWSWDHQEAVLEALTSVERHSLSRWDEVTKCPSWQELERAIGQAVGWTQAEQEQARALRTVLHWRRLRSVKNYGPALQDWVLKSHSPMA